MNFLFANLINFFFVVKLSQIRVLNDLKNSDSFGRIEFKSFLDEIHTIIVNVWKIITFMSFFTGIYKVKIFFTDVGFEVFDFIRVRSPSPVKNPLKLIHGRRSWEHRLPSDHFPNQAPQGPYINLFRVVFTSEQQLRGPVPPGSNVIRHHHSLIILCLLKGPHKPKVTQFSLTIFINQHIGWFKIPVDDIGIVEV